MGRIDSSEVESTSLSVRRSGVVQEKIRASSYGRCVACYDSEGLESYASHVLAVGSLAHQPVAEAESICFFQDCFNTFDPGKQDLQSSR